MATIVGVRFKKSCKIYFFDPAETGVKKGDAAIVETIRGVEYGDVVLGPREIEDEKLANPLKPVLRKATAKDAEKMEENKIREKEAFNICLHKIQNHELPMNLVDVEFTFDVGKIIFYFTAEGRVDFRELVKDLASVFHTRIELRQIGVRDEAKMLGGIGYCGRPICCATFLGDFAPVSIRMAKTQNLSLNPTKISGICGRLLCCLQYEDDNYIQNGENTTDNQKEQTLAPKIGSIVATPQGEGRVMGISRQDRTAEIQLAPNNVVTVDWDEIVDAVEVKDD
ncbi:MAG: stage 0 sporulation family protein [Phascolarctobacterium sp.]|nr:stage 0 sporulation family protein [Candidatus Phascolarctobacterium caballi]